MNPKIRQTIYQLGTVLTGVLGIALVWGGIDAGSAQNIDSIVQGLIALLGSGASGLAATVTKEQRKDGTLEPKSPLEQILRGAQQVQQAKAVAEDEYAKAQSVLNGLAQSGVTPFIPPSAFNPAQVVSNVVAPIPVVGPLTKQLLEPFR